MGGSCNWRDGEAYSHLLLADRTVLAFEWLRRTAAYQAASGSGSAARPADFGLHQFIDPSTGAPDARPMWRAGASHYVLRCHARPGARPEDSFNLSRLGPLASLEDGRDGLEHLLISDGLASIRLDILSGTVRHQPVSLNYELDGVASAGAPLLTLRRFLAVAKSGSFSRALHSPERRAIRFVRELRVHDALVEGASQRDIAVALFERPGNEIGWRLQTPSLRLQVQRLVRRARYMEAGGYRDLLRPVS